MFTGKNCDSIRISESPSMVNPVNYERVVALMLSVTAALVLSPIVGLLTGMAWFSTFGFPGSDFAPLIAAFGAFILIVWKGPRLFRKLLQSVWHTGHRLVFSCISLGLTGAVLVGGLMFAGILFLGHTRPQGLDFNSIPLGMGFGFVVSVIVGFPVVRKNSIRR
jgi:hypothetical protein